MTYTYFIVYTVPADGGTGNTALTKDHPISTIDDIREVEQQISTALGGRQVVVTDWREFPRVGTEYA